MPASPHLPPKDQHTLAYLRISLTQGLGPQQFRRLSQAVGKPEAVDSHTHEELVRIGLTHDTARALLSENSLKRAREEWTRATAQGFRIVDLDHPEYPQLLREISDPPPVLYLQGQPLDHRVPHIAVVGTRNPSPYGVNCAVRISRDLARHGVTVISGLARGIDTAAHEGALDGGRTIAVLGTGVDRVYPAENRNVSTAIADRGTLISEFPLGTPPLPQNFPRRNRVLAGLALATVVVEATERSGSLITARLALDADREVFAVPGPIQSLKSRGCHQLIQEGACLVTGWEDIARELSPRVEVTNPAPQRTQSPGGLSQHAAQLLDNLSCSEETSFDVLLARMPAPTQEVYNAILDLELRGLVRRLPGDRYILSELPGSG